MGKRFKVCEEFWKALKFRVWAQLYLIPPFWLWHCYTCLHQNYIIRFKHQVVHVSLNNLRDLANFQRLKGRLIHSLNKFLFKMQPLKSSLDFGLLICNRLELYHPLFLHALHRIIFNHADQRRHMHFFICKCTNLCGGVFVLFAEVSVWAASEFYTGTEHDGLRERNIESQIPKGPGRKGSKTKRRAGTGLMLRGISMTNRPGWAEHCAQLVLANGRKQQKQGHHGA